MLAHSFIPSLLNRGLYVASPQPTLTPSNCEVSMRLFNAYRNTAISVMPITQPDVYYKVYHNAPDSPNGTGIHEKFIHHGFVVVDVSVGVLDFPWVCADSSQQNEIMLGSLAAIANIERDPIIAGRLRQLAVFAQTLPVYTKFYYYRGEDGVRSLTVVDTSNEVKMNLLISWSPQNT